VTVPEQGLFVAKQHDMCIFLVSVWSGTDRASIQKGKMTGSGFSRGG